GKCVELTADRVHRTGDVERGPLRRALEEQVLEEVASAGQRQRLVSRSNWYPHAHAETAHPGHGLGDDPQTARQHGAGDLAPAGRREPSRRRTRETTRGGSHRTILERR